MRCRTILSVVTVIALLLALPDIAASQVTVPPGYTSVLYHSYGDSGAFHANVPSIAFGNGGLFGTDLFLTDNTRDGGAGRLVRVTDTNGNGQIDAGEPAVIVFQGSTGGMRYPVGLAFGKGAANAFDNDLFFADDYDGTANTVFRVSDNNGVSLTLGTFLPAFTFWTPVNPVFKADGSVMYLSDMQNFTTFGGGTDGLIYRILPTGARNTFRSGLWDVSNADMTPDGWLVVLNSNFLTAGGTCCLGTGQILALRDNNSDGDAQDAGETKVLVDQNSGFGRFPAFAYGPDGAAYVGVAVAAPAGSPATSMTQIHRLADLNGDGDYWSAGANTFDAGEKTLWASGIPGSVGAIRFSAAGEMYVSSLGSLGTVFTARVTRIYPLPSTDVEIEKSASTSSPVVGQPFTYTLTITNHGPASASNVVALDTLPAGLTFGSAVASQGSCSGTSSLNCALGTLAAAATATVSMTVTPTAAGSITNTATVSSNNLDPTPANNSDSVTVDALGDADGDGVGDANDNCPNQANASQADTDGDHIGDVCDPNNNDGPLGDLDGDGIINDLDADDNDGPLGDLDSDGVLNGSDNCASTANASQINTDGDGQGDTCDADDDNDGVPDASDTFPLDVSESVDTDHDGAGNNADPDDDNDGVADVADVFPLDASESVDTDHDSVGNNADPDDDNDGVMDAADAFPLDATESVDTDHDGIGNNADADDDNDGVADAGDAFPLDASESVDTDLDGTGNNADTDDDGDGLADSADPAPLDPDADDDGIGDGADNCVTTSNANQLDTDGDGIGNACEATVHVTGAFTASAKPYDGDISAGVLSRTLAGVAPGDDVVLVGGTATFADSGAGGSKVVTLAGATLSGASAAYYVLDSVNATTAAITQAPLTVSAINKSRPYGSPNPAFDATIAGFVNGETLSTSGVSGSPSCSTTATAASPVTGSPYAIACGLGSLAAANYSFSFAPGSLTVTQSPTTTVVSNAATSFSDSSQVVTLSASVVGSLGVNEGGVTFTVKNGAAIVGSPVTVPAVSGAASGGYTLPAGLDVANYTIEAFFIGSGNFQPSAVGVAVLTVAPAPTENSGLTSDADFNRIDGFDALFGKGDIAGQQELKGTRPGVFHHDIEIKNTTGVVLDAAHGNQATTFIEVPAMADCGGVPCPPSVDTSKPAFMLRSRRAIRVTPNDQTDEMPVTFKYKASGVCTTDPDDYSLTLPADQAPKCIMVTGFALPVRHIARIRLNFEFRWKKTDGWQVSPKDAKTWFRSGFVFRSTLVFHYSSPVPMDHVSHVAVGLVGAGQRVTAIGGMVLNDADYAGVDGARVRLFDSMAHVTACGIDTNVVAEGTVNAYGFYFIWKKGSDQMSLSASELPAGVKYAVQVCEPGGGSTEIALRLMSDKLNNKEFDEENFIVTWP